MSFVATDNGKIIGAVLCGHDGRRGYIHHLAVAETHQKKGIGRKLTERCLESLKNLGIQKCHLFIFEDNEGGQKFWESLGWTKRVELTMMSQQILE